MRFPLHRRWIVLVTLMCQVLAGAIGHVPPAHAATEQSSAAPAECPDHVHAAAPGGNAAADTGDAGEGHSGHCGGDACKCPCVHAPALSSELAVTSALAPHPPLPLAKPVCGVPERMTPFFRPPI